MQRFSLKEEQVYLLLTSLCSCHITQKKKEHDSHTELGLWPVYQSGHKNQRFTGKLEMNEKKQTK